MQSGRATVGAREKFPFISGKMVDQGILGGFCQFVAKNSRALEYLPREIC